MARVRTKFLCSLGAVAVLAALSGCNGSNIDDPDNSDSLLIIDSVTPSSVQANVTGVTDPNTLVVTPPEDDKIEIEVRNMNRTQASSGVFGDVILSSYDLTCNQGSLQLAGPTTNIPASLTIPADTSASINVVVASGAYKVTYGGTLVGLSDVCQITFSGEDLSGEPIISKTAVFGISFVN